MLQLVRHANFQEARKQLIQTLQRPEKGRMIFIIGPSGVGKTTMRWAVLRELMGKPAHWERGQIPIIEVLARLDKQSYFSSRSLVEALVEQLFVPQLKWLRDTGERNDEAVEAICREVAEAKSVWDEGYNSKVNEPQRWSTFERLAIARRTWLVCIDQAAALCTNHRNKDPADHIINLMTLAESSGLNFVLSGIHTAAALWEDRPEIRRRSDIIWMRPYSHQRRADRDLFLQVLKTFQSDVGYAGKNLLIKMAPELMSACAGVFGVLEKILKEARFRAEADERQEVSKGDIEASYYGARDYKKVWEDVERFEEIMGHADVRARAAIVAARWANPNAASPASGAPERQVKGNEGGDT
jgi:energy-coupling factor transporter ATP-binding protein EcfA2